MQPDAVAHTILLMAHEKAGRWEAAMDTYAGMQRRGLPRDSFTYRRGRGGVGSAGGLHSIPGAGQAGGPRGRQSAHLHNCRL